MATEPPNSLSVFENLRPNIYKFYSFRRLLMHFTSITGAIQNTFHRNVATSVMKHGIGTLHKSLKTGSEEYPVVTGWNLMVCDIQEFRVGDLMVPSGLRRYEIKVTTQPTESSGRPGKVRQVLEGDRQLQFQPFTEIRRLQRGAPLQRRRVLPAFASSS